MSTPHGDLNGDLTFAKLNPQAFHFSQKTSLVVIGGLIATIDFRVARNPLGTIPAMARSAKRLCSYGWHLR
jgi:hypothetical protein